MADLKPPRNIYIVGAQNTGKTTLVNALEATFAKNTSVPQPRIIKEVARNVLIKHNFTAQDITTSPSRAFQLQELILKAQFEAEQEVLERGGWFISDRSAVDPIVYAHKYVSEVASLQLRQSTEWLQLEERMKNSLVIVCQAGADWLLDDGVRLMPENREAWIQFDRIFCSCLDEWGLEYDVVPFTLTDIDERVEFVLKRWRLRGEKETV
ncbi:P-loop containing nucleoside triphosphate hydrolase [Glarea lozoyensis ATCC 20868]|uniref:p-loop containing nucleoside triphosphate hydrolase n=1 Tax=Glarea lozoyensis (strain ATCC 20868 / MF5171) TaxID=1116229 RepID=S3CS88_GLAL2|nr:P-loop containing nucleoside triphosphate hydrolase [Glarea lozoyensis ATCC 20868]EPE27934.1 P-loop containing nucleoside triphosphate hydrolase [Glarea lozoyensis ATCC 20868]